MTIEEQMYDEIMHKMPHRIAELVKTIDTIHKMLEAKHLGALSDNLDQLKKTLAQTEQEYKNLYEHFYDGKHYDLILPQTFNNITEDFIDSGHIENKINEMTPGTEMDCYTPLKEYDRKMSFDLYDNFFNFSQNEDFKTFCEYYYNEEYDIEESGTFEDNYIDENGIFDFKKFCDNTYFKSDIMDDMTLSILNSEKVCEATEKAKEIRLEQYADEIEIQTEMEQYHDDEEQTQEQDIDTFINSYDDIQATILYTNGDGNHINEIKCISDGKMLTLDVSKMNLASDTSMEKLQQIAKNIIASTKAKDPIIKPEPIKQNNDFER